MKSKFNIITLYGNENLNDIISKVLVQKLTNQFKTKTFLSKEGS